MSNAKQTRNTMWNMFSFHAYPVYSWSALSTHSFYPRSPSLKSSEGTVHVWLKFSSFKNMF